MNNLSYIYFGAPWCGPCKTMKPLVIEFFNSIGVEGEVIDVDANPEVSNKYNISSVPALVLLVDGVAAASHRGAITRVKLAELARNVFGT